MAQKPIREYDGKALFAKHWNEYFDGFHYDFKSVLVTSGEELLKKAEEHGFEWLKQEPLVAKQICFLVKEVKMTLFYLK